MSIQLTIGLDGETIARREGDSIHQIRKPKRRKEEKKWRDTKIELQYFSNVYDSSSAKSGDRKTSD